MQSDWPGGNDRLLGTALSQTSSISAFYPLPRAGSCSVLFRGDLFSGSKLLTFHVYCIFLFVLFVFYRPQHHFFPSLSVFVFNVSSLHLLTLALSFIYLSVTFWALLLGSRVQPELLLNFSFKAMLHLEYLSSVTVEGQKMIIEF